MLAAIKKQHIARFITFVETEERKEKWEHAGIKELLPHTLGLMNAGYV